MKPYTRPSFWCTIVTEHLPGFCRLKYRYGKDEYMKEMTQDSLNLFTQPTASWFRQAFGQPTKVQQEAWPAIKAGGPVLISAPTGTGKTLSAFLVFIDRLQALAKEGGLKEELYLIYVSPLKSLAGDIRENLNRPLVGIGAMEGGEGAGKIRVGIRTGDTPQKERQRMVKHPPHILIITPESLYLMLTSRTGRTVLKTAGALVIDELHALIDTKRGAHLMLSAARLDSLCGHPLQRIGLSATIEPLQTAAGYLSPEPAHIVAPKMQKEVQIEVNGIAQAPGRRKDPVWEELAEKVYSRCLQCRSVIAFSEGRRYAEKLAYYVNQLGGEDFARVHHGSLSKEQRAEVEDSLRKGNLRLLCATSSMELGIDVGDIDQVLQIGCPRTISSTMQRLGRAGHNPGRVSVMYMYPRTASETLYCGMTAQVARQGGIEQACPPGMCLDVLAQHLVSMAATAKNQETDKGSGGIPCTAYTVDDVMEILSRTYTFRSVTRQDVKDVLAMLAGDHEHKREIPVRPRILYDRLHEQVFANTYSRMLAVAAGGTIPDKGMYTAKTEEGVKVGELDEEFVYESQLGDRFLLGSFAWKIVGQDKDTVVVTQTGAEGARLPFWKGEIKGRSLGTSLAFGRIMRTLSEAERRGRLTEELENLGLDQAARENTSGFLERQLKATGILPDDRTIVAEHFKDSTGSSQIMLHALFGKRINTPLSLLLQDAAQKLTGNPVGCVEEEDGILLYPYGEEVLPEGILFSIDTEKARKILEAMLPAAPVFNMTFRYNAARALMMGMKQNGRQPLWMQRLRSTEMLESLVQEKNHPLIRETQRECLEDQWDIEGMLGILHAVQSGQIAVREVYLDTPSPMSLPMQWRVEAAEMYEYSPTTPGIRQAVYDELRYMEKLKPSAESLKKVQERRKLPEDAAGLHTLLMMEGDVTVTELQDMYAGTSKLCCIPDWLEELAAQELADYMEPGLWIAAEQREEYKNALTDLDKQDGMHIIRRMLYYRGPRTAKQIQERYLPGMDCIVQWLETLCTQKELVEDSGFYYHAKLYDRARNATIRGLRTEAVTQPPEHYASLMAGRVLVNASPEEQLKQTIESFCGQGFPVIFWENIIFARRIRRYSEGLLDRILTEGDYFWKMLPGDMLCFLRYEEIDWDAPLSEDMQAEESKAAEEQILYRELCRRGASFLKALTHLPLTKDVRSLLMELAEKGMVSADSFVPVRQWLNREKIRRSAARQRVNARIAAMTKGRWDVVHPQKKPSMEELLEIFFRENIILCRETFRRSLSLHTDREQGSYPDWKQALEVLRIWEFTGRARRGYFVRGLSGAQFIRKQDYKGIVQALAHPDSQIIWLNAADPMQLWGRVLEHLEGRSFLNVPGTAVALQGGIPVMVLERQGKVLRVLEDTDPKAVLKEFVLAFREKALFPDKKRLTVKEYPAEMGDALKEAGFTREMMDHVLYR